MNDNTTERIRLLQEVYQQHYKASKVFIMLINLSNLTIVHYHYLADKGYIIFEQDRYNFVTRITAKGTDYVESNPDMEGKYAEL